MGGFAVVVDWDRPVQPGEAERMMDLIPHRATAGIRTHVTDHAVLAEGRTTHQVDDRPWSIATLGPLAIVGDIRLYDTGRLRAAAGGDTATRGLDDRQILLAAYRRKGIDFLDAVDGDFSFVIWDDAERRVLAVRDRFAVKPIFYEETPRGIRFGSEAKQLAFTSRGSPAPDPRSIGEYILQDFREATHSFLSGIRKVGASDVLIADAFGRTSARYWTPLPTGQRHDPSRLPGRFRDELIAATERRLRSSRATVCQLSGGLDSPSIAAAAAILIGRGSPADFATVSAVYDLPSIDESTWIDDIVALQPFPHIDFVPEVADISRLDRVMRIIDGPFVDPNPDMDAVAARVAVDRGAGLVTTGVGGDHISYQARYLGDLLRYGNVLRFARDTAAYARWSRTPITHAVARALRQTAPDAVRRVKQRIVTPRSAHDRRILGPVTTEALHEPMHEAVHDFGFGSQTQNAIASDLRAPRLAWTNETQAMTYGMYGLDVSHPYLDRDLAEFVISIDPRDLPFDGRTKTLVRQAFAADLPGSVLARTTPTFGDEYIRTVLRTQFDAYRARFPTVSDRAEGLVNQETYPTILARYDADSLEWAEALQLFRTWHAMAWVEELGS
jgi:asparagine synthetase B (glutamine-hydrolysing)